jgi:beta-lactamase regulating signal transducer with metallopeptidase domain/predicted  nucleic acid-binding Zn-ribbon protein
MNIALSSLMSAWGWALIDFLWQGPIVGLLCAFLLMLFRHASAQIRYAIACSALFLCFMLPIFNVIRALPKANPQALQFITTEVAAPSATFTTRMSLSSSTIHDTLHMQMPWLVLIWSMGCLFFALRMSFGLSWLAKTRGNALPNENMPLQTTFAQLLARLNMRRPIQLLISHEIDSPMTAGCWKPMILMPAVMLTRLSPDLIEALLAHELAHIKRNDYLINLIQNLIEIILFFHPVVWWISKQIRIERENIADDLAAAILQEPKQLALALAALDEFQHDQSLLAPAAHGGNLMSRIQRLVKPTPYFFSWKITAAITSLAFVCMTVYAQSATTDTSKPVAPIETVEVDEPVSIENIEPDKITKADTPSLLMVDNKYKINLGHHDSYAIITSGEEGFMMSGDLKDFKWIEMAKKIVPGNYLWLRRGKKIYIVQEPDVIAQIKTAWQDTNEISARMDAIGATMHVQGEVMNKIGVSMDAVSSGNSLKSAAMTKISQQIEAIGKQQQLLTHEMVALHYKLPSEKSEKRRDAIQDDIEALNEKISALEEKKEPLRQQMSEQAEQLQQSLEPLAALSKEMEAANKLMEPSNEEMQALSMKMQALSKIANEKSAEIIDNAMKNGKAQTIEYTIF